MIASTHSSPLVTVGLAVYNGENYLREAIDSILNQTFTDFELIISDNASTDDTAEICQTYASQDSRIRYSRADRNRGAAWNQSRVMELANGKYFMLQAHDDLRTADYLEKAVAVLENDEQVVLCHSWTRKIDDRGAVLEDHYGGQIRSTSQGLKRQIQRLAVPFIGDGTMKLNATSAHVRFRSIVCTYNYCYQIFGLMRTSALRKTDLWGNYNHADNVLLSHLILLGRFHEIPENLFLSRRHAQQSEMVFQSGKQQKSREYAIWWDPDNADRIIIPRWKTFCEYAKVIRNTPASPAEKAGCYFEIVRWLRGCSSTLMRETIDAFRQKQAMKKTKRASALGSV
jgi:glycosyltransferase involved in cell wall biosynthesis